MNNSTSESRDTVSGNVLSATSIPHTEKVIVKLNLLCVGGCNSTTIVSDILN